MFKFQCKITILNFLTCANLHIIEKPMKQFVFYDSSLIPHLTKIWKPGTSRN